ncbi:sugar O-acyltransferase, sialic acid O-acetyltransferase NeuD family [Belliella buryatensis]|uniref:Sugar O-acyltransferase, sialic acid O-acetyltransferase NeuD family n=1 Tax=Belliella buryatensis TaxID=1500549 RepID=A0A239GW95_9BACT|nr:acetyltransferase [Belliella buryatensis]SNS73410.1 sugar O-acyltransferase, sialic acid O-acetyltransferase NeuD family [Belliella buryatensis]
MYIIGASGHAKSVIDLMEDKSVIKAIFDDNIHLIRVLGLPVTTPIPPNLPLDQSYIIAIGNNRIRFSLVDQKLQSARFTNIIHPTAIISKTVNLGVGLVIMEGAIIKVDTKIGNHVIVNTAAIIDHDCKLADYVHIAPSATLCGGVEVGEGTLVGAKSIILPNITIGRWCTIAAGSTVHKNLSDGSVWIGNALKKQV